MITPMRRPDPKADGLYLGKRIIRNCAIVVILCIAIMMAIGKNEESNQEPIPPAMVQNPNNPAIDYDWDRGVYIYARDTAYLEKDPFRRTWVPKGTLKKIEYKEKPTISKKDQEEVWKQEQALEDLGDDAYEYYR